MSIAIIANPLAGRGRGKRVAELVTTTLKAKNADFELVYTRFHRDAVDIASRLKEKHEVIAALGGDGTISEVLEGIWDSKAVLGIIPSGTGNDYARGLQLPLQPLPALEVLLQGTPRPMDVGVEKDKIFGVLASIGFPVSVIAHVNAQRDGWLKGPLAIMASVWKTIKDLEAFDITVHMDGQILHRRVVGVLAMNMPYGGGGLKFAPEARFNDGDLSVVIVKEVTKFELLTTLPKVYSGKHVGHPAIEIIRGRKILIESEPLPKMFDGDLKGDTPLDVQIHPGAARVIAG